jgi:precorrin-2/cobalt-factor-2 C20-methyltransferase
MVAPASKTTAGSPVDRHPSPGRLVGVGVGPGDPKLLTLQALAELRAADRVVAPVSAPDVPGRAEGIVRHAAPELRIVRLPIEMAAAGGGYQAAAETILPWLDAGETVAFATLGDPSIYSTFPAFAQAVLARRPETTIEWVPGICAFQALAARTGTVLVDGTEQLSLVTALDGPGHLEAALRGEPGSIVVYKGGRHLPAIAASLAAAGRLEGAVAGELLGLPGERVGPVGQLADQPAAYLSTVLVPPPGRRPGPLPAEGTGP